MKQSGSSRPTTTPGPAPKKSTPENTQPTESTEQAEHKQQSLMDTLLEMMRKLFNEQGQDDDNLGQVVPAMQGGCTNASFSAKESMQLVQKFATEMKMKPDQVKNIHQHLPALAMKALRHPMRALRAAKATVQLATDLITERHAASQQTTAPTPKPSGTIKLDDEKASSHGTSSTNKSAAQQRSGATATMRASDGLRPSLGKLLGFGK